MSDQRRTDHSQANSDTLAQPMQPSGRSYWAGLKKRLPFYVVAGVLVVLALAWIDGGEEPLHPISQAIDLNASAPGVN